MVRCCVAPWNTWDRRKKIYNIEMNCFTFKLWLTLSHTSSWNYIIRMCSFSLLPFLSLTFFSVLLTLVCSLPSNSLLLTLSLSLHAVNIMRRICLSVLCVFVSCAPRNSRTFGACRRRYALNSSLTSCCSFWENITIFFSERSLWD